MSQLKLSNEQSLAINTKPGFVLSAGAGSGKTFVLVEYIVNYIFENLASKSEKEIKSSLNQIYLMTFTKKATAEIYLRIQKRVLDIKKADSHNQNFWEIIEKNLFLLRISTIDSFCMSLLENTAYLQNFKSLEIKNSEFINLKIEKIFSEWFLENESSFSKSTDWSFTELLNSITEIFNEPEIRIEWTANNKKTSLEEEFTDVFKNFIKNSKLNLLESGRYETDFSNLDPSKPITILFQKILKLKGANSICSFQCLDEVFINIKSFPQKLNSMNDEQIILREEIKILYDFFKKVKEDFLAANEEKDSYYGWQELLVSACKRIEEKYHQIPGYSFSDITYFTYKLLCENSFTSMLPEIRLMIVDEFQDTSRIQFEIIQRCLKGDLNKLIVVGDKKQAIYGFRGGDVGVYRRCEELQGSERIINLKDNYRSESEIVHFNNDFFHKIFKLSDGYVDSGDIDSIMESQNPKKIEKKGKVVSIVVNVVKDKEINLDSIEAELIKNEIVHQLENGTRQIAILYKNLNPSFMLIDELLNAKIDFTAQVKISNKDDLIVVLCEKLLAYSLVKTDKDKRALNRIVEIIVKSINPAKSNFEFSIMSFEKNLKLFGFHNAFLLYLTEVGVSAVHFKENLENLKNLLLECKNNLEAFHYRLKNLDQKYSVNFVSGNGEKVTIQTAHQSKGLEYDSVILGGIYTNGTYQGFRRLIGNIQGSFRWYSRKNRKFYKSINYFLDELIEKEKNFLESKRLFYVACTRAKNNLHWVNLKSSDGSELAKKNSWAIALNNFSDVSLINFKQIEVELNLNSFSSIKTPLFYKLDIGIQGFESANKFNIIPELSVSKLSKLILCPRAFYLESVCKIESISGLRGNNIEDELFLSSKKRGIYFHNILNDFIKFQKVPKKLNENDKKIFDWATVEIKTKNFSEFFSEEEIKFELNNLMINAVPDLVLINEDCLEIIDYKTGSFDKLTNESYFFQVICYLYGYLKINPNFKSKKLKATILYLDQFSSISKDLEFKDVLDSIDQAWCLLDKYDQVNLEHCTKCSYSNLCKYSRSIDTH